MTACRRSSPVSTYRLVNMSVNPAGRLGAPETDSCGSDGELMKVSFSTLVSDVGKPARIPLPVTPVWTLVGSLVCIWEACRT